MILRDDGGPEPPVMEQLKQQEYSVAWQGPDDSIILTCPEGWGSPGHIERDPLYCGFGERGTLCP